jgi:hypothetical protein
MVGTSIQSDPEDLPFFIAITDYGELSIPIHGNLIGKMINSNQPAKMGVEP